ncbi:hypothetical protein ACLOJK_005530 [Asimina triloba]
MTSMWGEANRQTKAEFTCEVKEGTETDPCLDDTPFGLVGSGSIIISIRVGKLGSYLQLSYIEAI